MDIPVRLKKKRHVTIAQFRTTGLPNRSCTFNRAFCCHTISRWRQALVTKPVRANKHSRAQLSRRKVPHDRPGIIRGKLSPMWCSQGSQQEKINFRTNFFSKFQDILSVSQGSKHRKSIHSVSMNQSCRTEHSTGYSATVTNLKLV